MKVEFGRKWSTKLKMRIESYQFEVGILDDKPYKLAIESTITEPEALGTYAGGPVRKKSRDQSGLSIGQVLRENMKRLNIDLLRDPFKNESSDIMKFTTAFLKTVVAKKSMKRVENLLQAIVRNPILRQDYGMNSKVTAKHKGFDRHMFDTGQMFQSIKARAKRV